VEDHAVWVEGSTSTSSTMRPSSCPAPNRSGYIFVHRLFLEYFASLETTPLLAKVEQPIILQANGLS
jgi:hypothetical protein